MKALDDQAVIHGYQNENKSLRDLADEFGVSTRPIRRILIKHGIEMRPAGVRGPDKKPRQDGGRGLSVMTQEERQEITRRFLDGDTQVELAAAFKCGATTIARVLRAEGVPPGAHGQLREHHHAWKGGKTLNGEGYVMVRVDPDDPIASAMGSRYVLEHRLVVAQSLGRALEPEETVHHINNNKTDNRIENLQLHDGRHGRGAAARCRKCGSQDIEFLDL